MSQFNRRIQPLLQCAHGFTDAATILPLFWVLLKLLISPFRKKATFSDDQSLPYFLGLGLGLLFLAALIHWLPWRDA